MPTLVVADIPMPFGNYWIHLKAAPKGATKPYRLSVASDELERVFDPHKSKIPDMPWGQFVSQHIDEFGSFILGGYFENMMKLTGESKGQYLGVLATVDDVVESDEGLLLLGQIEEWCPEKYA